MDFERGKKSIHTHSPYNPSFATPDPPLVYKKLPCPLTFKEPKTTILLMEDTPNPS
jgi:hypothetical protein